MSTSHELSAIKKESENSLASETASDELLFQTSPLMLASEIRERILHFNTEGQPMNGILHSSQLDLRLETDQLSDFLYIGNPFDKTTDIIKVPTKASLEDIEAIKAEILPIPEAYEMLVLIAQAYASKQPLILEGPTSIGKTYLIDRFTEMVYGPTTRPYDFYCTAQTDVSELTAKWVPNKNKRSQDDPSFVLQYGALPKAMGIVQEADGQIIRPGDRETGNILHIQEIGLAEPAIINVLLQLRGRQGKINEAVRLWDDGGALVKPAEDFWIVMSTNPPEEGGYLDRNLIDPALARGALYIRLRELSRQSFQITAKEYLQKTKNGEFLEIHRNKLLVNLLSNVLGVFHETVRDFLIHGERGRGQRVPVTLTDIMRVVEYLNHHQVFSIEKGTIDLTQTLRKAVKLYYLSRLADIDLVDKLENSLEELLTGDLGAITKTDGSKITFEQAVAELIRQDSQDPEEQIEQYKNRINQSQSKIQQALTIKLGSKDLLPANSIWRSVVTLANEAANTKNEKSTERLAEIVDILDSIDLNYKFKPEALKPTEVIEAKSSHPALMWGNQVLVTNHNTLQIFENSSLKEVVEIGKLPIEDLRINQGIVYAVAGDEFVYTYDLLTQQKRDSLQYCASGAKYEAVSVLPFQAATNAKENGIIVGTKQATAFIQTQGHFKATKTLNKDMAIDLLESFTIEDNLGFIVGQKQVSDNPEIISETDSVKNYLGLRYCDSILFLPDKKELFVGHATEGSLISHYEADAIVCNNKKSLSKTQRTNGFEVSSVFENSIKGISFLAANQTEDVIAFASRLEGTVGFFDIINKKVSSNIIRLPENITGLQITNLDQLIVTTRQKVYIYANVAV